MLESCIESKKISLRFFGKNWRKKGFITLFIINEVGYFPGCDGSLGYLRSVDNSIMNDPLTFSRDKGYFASFGPVSDREIKKVLDKYS